MWEWAGPLRMASLSLGAGWLLSPSLYVCMAIELRMNDATTRHHDDSETRCQEGGDSHVKTLNKGPNWPTGPVSLLLSVLC